MSPSKLDPLYPGVEFDARLSLGMALAVTIM
jgi:hypothetical protein